MCFDNEVGLCRVPGCWWIGFAKTVTDVHATAYERVIGCRQNKKCRILHIFWIKNAWYLTLILLTWRMWWAP